MVAPLKVGAIPEGVLFFFMIKMNQLKPILIIDHFS
jgi:hypothetical protein